jgi:LmbE family N-acetylglucosaminyl deacetylase
MAGSQALAPQAVRWLASRGLPAGSRVLVVGEAVAPTAAAASPGVEIVVADPLAPALPRGPFAAALLERALDRVEWDRWLLERLRPTLVDGAPVRIRVRNLASLASPGDALELAARVGRELARRTAKATAAEPFRGRRYTPARLRALLTPTGYDVEDVRGARFGAEWIVEARARARDAITGAIVCGGCDAAVADFAHANADDVAAAVRWVRAHRGNASPPPPRVFDARAYAGRSAILLSPHPDDEVIGCGGTALRLARAGARVVCVQATDGSDSHALREAPLAERRTVRAAEARVVAQAAGFTEIEFWDADNAAFRSTPALVARLADLLARERPALVFTPFLTDRHPDHFTLSAILGEALARPDAAQATADCEVFGYEVWGAAPPDVVCDVTDLRAAHEALLWLYETGMKVDDFVELGTRRGFHHACVHLGRPGLAEVFFACPAREFPALFSGGYQTAPTASV